MKYILVTGSAGLIGSECVEFFLKKGHKVLGLDNNSRRKFFGKEGSILERRNQLLIYKDYKHFNLDIRNEKKIEEIFSEYKSKIKCIIHCAAQPSHDWAIKDKVLDYEINSTATLILLNAYKKYCPESPFIYVSTNKVYGDNPNKLKVNENKFRFDLKKKHNYHKGINENMSIDKCVHSFFGVSKLSADIMVQEYGVNFGMNTVCFRAGCITGSKHSGARLHGFLSYLVKKSISEKKYTVIGYKGKQVRDNIHSKDLVRCFWEYYKNPKKGKVYNIGGGRKCSCSVIEAINIIEKKLKIKIKLNFLKKARTGDHLWWISDNSRFIKDYPNFKIKYSIEKVIEELIANI